ncbi:MAG TPA: peroxiredoxin-like family protein [Methyloceanibacter sp.]|nr:peroxiredoxin-like family protein [Methyloceanibacter sp.]
MTTPVFHTLDEAFRYCRDMDASLRERLDAFSNAARALRPAMQDAVDRLVVRLMATDTGAGAPQIGDSMPNFVLSDERGELVSLDSLLRVGPVAVTFHRGHWCPYCRINTRALAEAQTKIAAAGAQIVAIMPDRATLKHDSKMHYPVLTDMDNGYALSLNLAIWVGAEVQELMASSGRDLPHYQGNDSWMLPLPASFVVDAEGIVRARFIDPDYRKRMAIEDLLQAVREARIQRPIPRW